MNGLADFYHYLKYLKENRSHFFEESKKDGELRELMQKEKMTTFFQPIISLTECGTIGFEILNRPNSTKIFPTTDSFYDHVGKSRKVFAFESFLRNLSLERYESELKQSDAYDGGLIFLNIQPQILEDPSYRSGHTLDLLNKYNLSPDQIVLELTEKETVADYGQFVRTIENYRQQGFRIAVDDAGTGYNSLKTILYLKPEFLKLDKALIRNIHINPAQQNLVDLLVNFAQQSNTAVIAEGIEILPELLYLQKSGVHLGQGYALGRPEQSLKPGILPTLPTKLQESPIMALG
ncbi:EAL domain-containing protein [Jeotgalibacillus campisalis]|uniref:Diguanylate cyclase n=1 Tax=Jeotgalibacillus campisalis TaxID=220754 RepID=A0A0C2RN94_9BACL|nr:EAL domain-containing protein [Jeotgalibacillus campisalis]KIL43259.1 diguanylate cyclase [Jeotgalibacillus campisalis]